jgi:site-specific recombinase XerD
MLRKIAWMLLVISKSTCLRRGKVTRKEIGFAAKHRPRVIQNRVPRVGSPWSRLLFIHVATAWFRFLGRLKDPPIRSPFTNQIDRFARFMRDERGLSLITITSRCERVANFLGTVQPKRFLRAISISDVDAYLSHQGKHGWSRPSLAALASDLRSFFRYAEGQHWCAGGIATAIETPRIFAQEAIPRSPTWEQVQQLIASTTSKSASDIRAQAIVMLLALYGLRRGEVVRLCLEDLDWAGEVLYVVRPKQRRGQRYPLQLSVGDAILRYLREVRPKCAHRELFLTLNAPVRPLSPASVTAIVRTRLTALGVQLARRGAHSLRHACARQLLASGFSLKQIGDHLGHRSASSTLIYAKVDLEGLRQVAELDLGGLL